MVALTIGMSVRPISHGMTYSHTETVELIDKKVTTSIKFKNKRVAVQSIQYEGEKAVETEFYYINNGNKFMILPQVGSAEDYDKVVDALKEDKDAWNELWKGNSVFTVNAFKLTIGIGNATSTATAGGAIALVTILAIVDLALVGCTALAVAYRVKKK